MSSMGLHPESAASAGETPGQQHLPSIPGYELLGILGAGGMGVVYQARHLALNRLVAIKIIKRFQQASEREILKLQLEGETVANLQHPNIVQLYQSGEFAGLPFLAFEFVEGGTLSNRIAGTPQPPRESVEIVESLARAVHVAHLRGVLHRDLKPANVLLSRDGVPKIADFGLARRLDRDEHSIELLAGTASYMSPEQVWGDSKVNPLTPATDVYSLGAILYELLTGRPPFTGDSTEQTLKDVWNKSPLPPRNLVPTVPLDVQTICLKCLEKEPSRRYASALALAEDLRRFLDSEPITARPTGRIERAVLWCRRDPVFAGMITALILVILAGAGFSSWLAYIYRGKRDAADQYAQRARDYAEQSDKRAIALAQALGLVEHRGQERARAAQEALEALALAEQRGLELAKAAADANYALAQIRFRDANLARTDMFLEHTLYENLMLRTSHDVDLMERDPAGPGRKLLAEHLDLCPRALRNLEWHIRNRQLQGSLLTRPVTRKHLVSMAVSPDGKWVATSARDPADTPPGEPIRVWSTDDWQLRAAVGGPGLRLRFSPDSRWLIVDNPSAGVEIWDWNAARLVRTFKRETDAHDDRSMLTFLSQGAIAFSTDGKTLAIVVGATVQMRSIDTEDFETSLTRTLPTGLAYAMQFCANNEQLIVLAGQGSYATGDPKSELQVWDTRAGTLLRKHKVDGRYLKLAASADGRQCLAAGYDQLIAWDVPGDRERSAKLDATIQELGFSRDGTMLLVANARGDIALLDPATLEQKVPPLHHGEGEVVAIGSLPDGRFVSATTEGTLKVWPPDGRSRTPRWYDGTLPSALSPDGAELAIVQANGAIRRVALESGRDLEPLPAQMLNASPLGIAGLCYLAGSGDLLVAYSDLSLRTWRGGSPVGITAMLTGPRLTRPDPERTHASGYFASNSPVPRLFLSDDGKYAAWTGAGQDPAKGPDITMPVWEIPTDRKVITAFGDQTPTDDGAHHKVVRFATLKDRVVAYTQQIAPNTSGAEVPTEGWDLTHEARMAKQELWQQLQTVSGPRIIRANTHLTIAAPGMLSMTSEDLLDLPLGATATGLPQLCANKSRIAVATDRGIAVFDVSPLPEFSLPDHRPGPPNRPQPHNEP